jgi:hypothetical protein
MPFGFFVDAPQQIDYDCLPVSNQLATGSGMG